MNKDKLKEVCAVRRNEMIGIACFMAGVAVTYTIFGKNRKGAYIATDLAVGDLGKLGELLIQRTQRKRSSCSMVDYHGKEVIFGEGLLI